MRGEVPFFGRRRLSG